jgi:hypothetical protein
MSKLPQDHPQDDASKYYHMLMYALMGWTAKHLRDNHGIEPVERGQPDWKHANAAAHGHAHGVPEDARWSYRAQRFVIPGRQP